MIRIVLITTYNPKSYMVNPFGVKKVLILCKITNRQRCTDKSSIEMSIVFKLIL